MQKRALELALLFSVLIFTSFGCSIEKGGNPNPNAPSAPSEPENPELRGFVSFAFDDGWRSTYQNAFPILDSAGFKGTSYIITGRLNSSEYVGAGEVLNLQSRGHEIGAHTRSHLDVVPMTPQQIQIEVNGSRADLVAIGVRTVITFSYPFGSYSGNAVQAVKNAGFKNARTSDGGFNSRSTDRFLLARQNLGGSTSLVQVQGWLDTAIGNNQWLILVSHHVDDTKSDFSITPDFFRDIVKEVARKRIRVVTISEGVERFLGPA